MRKLLFLVCLGISFCGGLAQVVAEQSSGPPASGWKLVFSDEFDGQQLDQTKWNVYEDCWGGGNQERECYTSRPENLSLHDGYLDLAARFEHASGPSLPLDLRVPGVEPPVASKPFTSAKISTLGRFSLTYGRVEVRARLPKGQGLWPAIWLLPQKDLYGPWPGSGEIDVMEAVNPGVGCSSCLGGVENNIYGTIHYGSNMHHQWQQKAVQIKKNSLGDWHTFQVDWGRDYIAWYVDGERYYRVKLANWRDTLQKSGEIAPAVANAPFDRPFFLIMNLAVGGLWPESHDQGGVALQGFPKTLGVDWVHIYRCEGVPDGAGGCAP